MSASKRQDRSKRVSHLRGDPTVSRPREKIQKYQTKMPRRRRRTPYLPPSPPPPCPSAHLLTCLGPRSIYSWATGSHLQYLSLALISRASLLHTPPAPGRPPIPWPTLTTSSHPIHALSPYRLSHLPRSLKTNLMLPRRCPYSLFPCLPPPPYFPQPL